MKLVKRFLSFALSVLLLCYAGQAAFASAGIQARTDYPTIYMAGGWHALTDTVTGEKVFDTSDSMTTDTSTQEMIFKAVVDLDFDALGDALIRMYTKAYKDIAMDCDGASINPNLVDDIRAYFSRGILETLYATPDEYLDDYSLSIKANIHEREDGSLFWDDNPNDMTFFISNDGYFSFDWRLDPVHNAALLQEWILERFIDSGVTDKVNIAFVSGSAPIGLAYLYEYGTQYLNAVTFNEGFQNGSSLWGGIALRQFGLSGDALGNTGPMYDWHLQDILTPKVIGVIRMLYEVGMIDVLAKFFNFVSSDAFKRLYEEALIPMWFHMPFYWCLVPHNIYEQAKRTLFPDHTSYTQHAKLFEMTDYYHNNILANSYQIVGNAAKDIKVGISCGYGFPLGPYSDASYVSSDELVDTVLASFGATCAPPNRPFNGFFYKQAKPGSVKGYSYVSPDRMIDASTCLLPDYTWFNKDMPHLPDIRSDGWVDWFCNAPRGEDSVHANAKYPQWMQFVDRGKFKPLEYVDTLWHKIRDTLLEVAMWLMKIWRRLLLLPLFWM